MNYGKRNSVKKQKKISSKSKMKKKSSRMSGFSKDFNCFSLAHYLGYDGGVCS